MATAHEHRTSVGRSRRILSLVIATVLLLPVLLMVPHLVAGRPPQPPFAPAGAPPAAPDQSLSFLALGDTGHASHNQRLVAHALSNATGYEAIDLVLLLGDNFYDDGVKSTDDPLWDRAFDNMYRLPGLAVPFYAVLGNHDHRGNIEAQIARSRLDPRWRMPASHYAWTMPIDPQHAVLFVALDTQTLAGRKPDDAQLAWLESTLAASKATWKIALGHHPILSAGPMSHPHLAELRDVLDRHRVSAYFCGHAHQLTYFRRPGAMAQIISGAGSESRALQGVDGADFAHRGLGFACVRLTPQAMLLSFLDENNAVLYVDTLKPRTLTNPTDQPSTREHDDP